MKCVKMLGTDDRGFQIVYGYMALNADGVAVASTARLQAMIDRNPRVTVVTPGQGRKVFLPADGMAYLEALQHEYYGSRLSATPVIDAPVEVFLNRLNEACEPDEAVKVMVVDEASTVVLTMAQYHAGGWAFIGVWSDGHSVVGKEALG